MDDTKNGTNAPCLKHAVSNLAEKSNDISSDVSLCSNCSKTMLSYIFLIQDVLDNLAKSIYGGRRDSQCCVQCLRQATQAELSKQEKSVSESKYSANDISKDEIVKHAVTDEETSNFKEKEVVNQAVSQELSNNNEESVSNAAANKAKRPSSRRNSRRLSREIKNLDKTPLKTTDISYVNQDWKIDFLYNVAADLIPILPTVKSDRFLKSIVIQEKCSKLDDESSNEKSSHMNEKVKNEVLPDSNSVGILNEVALTDENEADGSSCVESTETLSSFSDESCEDNNTTTMYHQYLTKKDDIVQENGVETCSETENSGEDAVSLPSNEVDFQFDVSQKPQKSPVHFSIAAPTKFEPLPEAFVTVCRNNPEAVGCLVLGSSLLLSRSKKILYVLVYEGIHEKLRELLASIFHVVQSVSSLDPVKNGSSKKWI